MSTLLVGLGSGDRSVIHLAIWHCGLSQVYSQTSQNAEATNEDFYYLIVDEPGPGQLPTTRMMA